MQTINTLLHLLPTTTGYVLFLRLYLQGDQPNPVLQVLKTPVVAPIKQLVISPLADYLAILTSHTIHLAVLPDSSHLSSTDTAPLRLKTFQLGPTAHVLEQAPIVSALWHPLAHAGACLVTVTADASVRLWELNRDARHSFDEPALALDLKKLGNASSSDDDFKASKYGTSKGFSPDSVEMEVAAACFGGAGTADEHGWSPMTLWVAMTEGDVYALCPLLPSTWEPTPTTIPSLSTSVVSKATILANHPDASEQERRIVDQQQRWLADIDSQDPTISSYPDSARESDVYFRPTSPPAIPKLQGPFQLTPDPVFSDITDIFVIAPRLDDDALLDDEDEDLDYLDPEGLSVGIICLATKAGDVHVCLDLNGVEAEWLPPRRARFMSPLDHDDPAAELVLLETISTAKQSAASWTMFTPDPTNRYGFLLTTSNGLFSVSLTPWIAALESELSNPSDSGAAFRLDILFDTEKTSIDHILELQPDSDNTKALPACLSLLDSDLGWFVLTSSTSNQPHALVLDQPLETDMYSTFAPDTLPLSLPAPQTRQHYQPSSAFFVPSTLPAFLDSITQSTTSFRLKKPDLKNQVRFSPATLQLLTEAHRVLSTETSRLGTAAADLFRRCERMKLELGEQIRRVDEIAHRIEAVTGDDDDYGAEAVENSGASVGRVVGKEKIEMRMEAAGDRAENLRRRVDALRRKMVGLGGRELSVREEAWGVEVEGLKRSIFGDSSSSSSLGDDESENAPVVEKDDSSLTARLDAVAKLQKELVARAKEVAAAKDPGSRPDNTAASTDEGGEMGKGVGGGEKIIDGVPTDFRKQKVRQVMVLLERESAMVDAVAERLSRLGGLGGLLS